MKSFLLTTFLFLSFSQYIALGRPPHSNDEAKFTISGYVKDRASGEMLVGASVYVTETASGTVSNSYGFYSVTLPQGNYRLRFSYLGYVAYETQVELSASQSLNVDLETSGRELTEVVISSEKRDQNIQSMDMSVAELNIQEVRKIPVIFGEQDILKTFQLMPGVKSAGEGGSGFYVRGGGTDQNLILLDEAPVYNASHLMGFFSVFNSDALKDAELYKGGIPAVYGGRMSSVMDIKMREGHLNNYHVSGGLGLISSRLTVEGPIVKDKGSFIVSGRRSYADLFLKLSSDEAQRNTQLYFYDLNLKANYRFNQNNRLFVSGYFGRDVFSFEDFIDFDWGNKTATVRWNHLFSDRFFSNTSLIYSDYDYLIGLELDDEPISISSGIIDYNFKQDFDFYASPSNTIRFGFNIIDHTFEPGKLVSDSPGLRDILISRKDAIESAVYAENEQRVTDWLRLRYGLRYSMFTVLGPEDVYAFSDEGAILDTTIYKNNEVVKNYGGFEPRFSANFVIDERNSVKASYNRTMQYIHLLSNSTAANPTDIWFPSTSIVKPGIADQVAAGWFRNFFDNSLETSVEVYYKWMQNMVDYKNGAEVLLNETVESELIFGKGISYGAEFYVRKKHGKFTGWLSYTLSRTEMQFDKINEGDWFPAKQDRIHDVALVGMYDVNPRWSLSFTWVYYTGDAVSFPSGKYTIDGQTVSLYTERNAYRMPDYHRMDFGATLNAPKSAKYDWSWNFSFYNLYGRKNAYSINFEENEDKPGETQAVKLYLFSIVPSITWNFKF